jgi:hypothetical protein
MTDEARVLKNLGQLPESTKLNEGDEQNEGEVEFGALVVHFLMSLIILIFISNALYLYYICLVDAGENALSDDEVGVQNRNYLLSDSDEDSEEESESEED